MKIANFFTPKNVKRSAGIYFIGLAVINLVLTWIDFGFKTLDLITLVIGSLPFIINKKMFYLIFGLFATFISMYLLLAMLMMSVNTDSLGTLSDSIAGFTLIGVTLLFSLGLIYVGLQSSQKDRFSLI